MHRIYDLILREKKIAEVTIPRSNAPIYDLPKHKNFGWTLKWNLPQPWMDVIKVKSNQINN